MTSGVVKRSVVVSGHRTSITLEEPFWTALKEIAREADLTLTEQVARIDRERGANNLSSAIRLFVLDHFRNARVHLK